MIGCVRSLIIEIGDPEKAWNIDKNTVKKKKVSRQSSL